MSHSPALYQWRTQIARHFPNLSPPLVMGLALWSLGMIMVRSCSLTAIADGWSAQGGQTFHTVRERLRDTYREAAAKAGTHRQQLDVATCWGPWLNWVLEGRVGTQLAVVLDATTLGAQFVILTFSVVYRGCAVPILWKILRAGVKHPWKPEWEGLEGLARARASDVDRDRPRRPRVICQMAVRGDRSPRLASDAARQCAGVLSPRGLVSLAPLS